MTAKKYSRKSNSTNRKYRHSNSTSPSSYSELSLPSLFDKKKIHAYFLSGGSNDRTENCLQMMRSMKLEPKHYDIIPGPMHFSNSQIAQSIQEGSLAPDWNTSRYQMSIKRFLCHLGKIKVLEAFLASDYEEMILFEDDVSLASKYSAKEAAEFMRLMLALPTEDYDMQYLGYCFECYRREGAKIQLNSTIKLTNNKKFFYTRVLMPLCNHAVLFKRKSAKAFIALSRPFKMPSDVALTHAICKTGQIALRPAYPIFVQNRKDLGSFMGHNNEVPAFREKYSSEPAKSGRCFADTNQCKKLFKPELAAKYGFKGRIAANKFLKNRTMRAGHDSALTKFAAKLKKSVATTAGAGYINANRIIPDLFFDFVNKFVSEYRSPI